VTATQKAFSASPFVLVTDGRRDKMERRGCPPWGEFLIRMLINRNASSIVEHILFSQMGTSSS
jgi:hypothetical protein